MRYRVGPFSCAGTSEPSSACETIPGVTEGTGRMEAFSDGIFAIAMTLLVLELHVPALAATGSAGELAKALLLMWPKFAGYGGSFLILGVLWIGHHNQFHYIRRVDRPFLWINIFFFMCVGFMPYCTALMGTFIWNLPCAASLNRSCGGTERNSMRTPIASMFFFHKVCSSRHIVPVNVVIVSRSGLPPNGYGIAMPGTLTRPTRI